jgi:hypothetical protein
MEFAPLAEFNFGSTAAASLAEKLTGNLIAAIDSATNFSSNSPNLLSLAFR